MLFFRKDEWERMNGKEIIKQILEEEKMHKAKTDFQEDKKAEKEPHDTEITYNLVNI